MTGLSRTIFLWISNNIVKREREVALVFFCPHFDERSKLRRLLVPGDFLIYKHCRIHNLGKSSPLLYTYIYVHEFSLSYFIIARRVSCGIWIIDNSCHSKFLWKVCWLRLNVYTGMFMNFLLISQLEFTQD